MKFLAVIYSFVVFNVAQVVVFSKTTINSSSVIELPDGFLLGAGTSAFQVEGGTSEHHGKSESFVEWLMHKLEWNTTADVASDSYHLYKEDIKILEYSKLNIYRFSLSWARLLPTGYPNFVNEDGVRYYHAILDELERIGVEPLVLLHHFDHPVVLETSNIWDTGDIVELFSDYARFIFQEFGKRIKNFVTFNEPNMFCHRMNALTVDFEKNNESKRMARTYTCGHSLLKAHAQVYHMYHKEFNSDRKGKISISIECEDYVSKNQGDELSAEVAYQFQCGWLAHPIYSKSGDYHDIIKRWVRENSFMENLTESRLPVFSNNWIKRIKGSSDYFGLSHYSSHLVEPAPLNDPKAINHENLMSDTRLMLSEPCGVNDRNTFGHCVAPDGFRRILRKIKQEYDNPVIYAINAIKYDNIDVKAYIYWSLIDSYEFELAYNIHFGLAHIDITSENRTRTMRKSAAWLRKVISSRKLSIEE